MRRRRKSATVEVHTAICGGSRARDCRPLPSHGGVPNSGKR